MNSKFALLAALAAGLLPGAALAQAAAPPSAPGPAAIGPAASAPQAPPPAVAPSAYPAKIALVNFQEAVFVTNEGQRAAEEVRKKYQTQKDSLDALAAEIDSLKKQLQAAPATLPAEERDARLKTIDDKDKQYQRDADDAQTAFNNDLQEALGKVAEKVHTLMLAYVAKNGYTILLNVDPQSTPVMWTAADPNSDITEAIVAAYNAASGIAPPVPAAPTATAHPKPAATAPHSTTTPHTATPAKPQ